MLLLIGKLLLAYLLLAGALYLFARFAHNFLYTEVPGSLVWRAPLAAAAVWLVGLAGPLLLNHLTGGKWPISFNELFLSSATKNAYEFKEFTVPLEGGREAKYVRRKNSRGLYEYLDRDNRPLAATEPVLIATDDTGKQHRFEIAKDEEGHIERSKGIKYKGVTYKSDTGLTMKAESLGTITASGAGQFFWSSSGGLVTLAAWFVALWLLLLLQWKHALGFAIPLMLGWAFAMNFMNLAN